MTPARLNHLIDHCFRGQRREEKEARYDAIARFLGVKPITLRRWLRGERPIPRQAEVIMEILHFWPDVRAETVDKFIKAVAEGTMT
jgi:hypothetical protein